MKPRYLFLAALLLVLAAAVVACAGDATQSADAGAEQEQAACPTAEPCPECEECPVVEPVATRAVETVPYEDLWVESAHADADAEAFHHWDEEDPAEVPTSCAKCHSTPGYLDFLGEDGSEFGVVDAAAPVGTVITCEACHNPTTADLTSVVMPSGVEITGLDDSARCMQCHQGRASTVSVTQALEESGVPDLDTVSEELGFINIHYYAAAATLFGHEAQGGFEYDGHQYVDRFQHVDGYDSCIGCHDSHSLELKVEECAACHEGVSSAEDFRNVRMPASSVDYDGDGDTEEGLYYELEGMRELLMQSIQAYASEVVGTPIAYDEGSHPYFFIDTNENGVVDEDEANGDNAYNAFTGRLMQATFNYQAALKDPGSYAHNGKYIAQLLYDSIESLNEQTGGPVDMAMLHRDPGGHFNSGEEAFHHWDEEGLVEAECTKCHQPDGLPFFIEHGETTFLPADGSLRCTTCHSSLEEFTVYETPEVTFPSGAVLGFTDDVESNICLNCHQGRQSTPQVDAVIAAAGVSDNQTSEALRFQNPHYFAAGATLFGAEAQGAYQYAGREYAGPLQHVGGFDSCQECHNVHTLEIRTEECETCHGTTDPQTIRQPDGDPVDWDGDGDVDEGIAGEIETMQAALLDAISTYAANTAGMPIVYSPSSYPYYYADPNGNGTVDEGEGSYANWTPTLLRAAYNYQYVSKDPGAFAHNNDYVMQLLYDSLQGVGGSQAVAGMTRP